ncbi:MAG: sulfatase/phosphatase domain-containing protein [Planctomycetota bacterium]
MAHAAVFVVSLTAGSAAVLAEPTETTPPNIVVFTVDDMDYTSVNALGNPMLGLTPHMDRLVREGTKNNLYKHSTHTPLIVRWPGRVEADVRHDASMVSTLDLMPTILEAVGLTPPDDLDGRTLWPLLRGETHPGRESVLTTTNFKQPGNRVYPTRALTTPRYSYIVNFWPDGRRKDTENHHGLSMRAIEHAAQHDSDMAALAEFLRFRRVDGRYVREELYDLQQDLWSKHNLVDDPDYAEALDELRDRMKTEMILTEDPLLTAFRDGSRYPIWWDDPAEMSKRGFKIIP